MRNPESISRIEVYRYMGFRDGLPEPHLQEIYEDVIAKVADAATPRFCSVDTEIEISGDKISFGGFSVESNALAKHLSGCKKV